MPKKLLVIIPDRLSVLIDKGEVVPRYYNPGDLFDEVHILMTNDDRPDPEKAQELVGRARLFFHNLPFGSGDFVVTLGMRPGLMTRWALPGMALAERIRPDLVRVHGVFANGFLAWAIKQRLGLSYIISVHGDFDEARRLAASNFTEKMILLMQKSVERLAISGANAVIGVYEFTRGYALGMGAKRFEVIHNVINKDSIVPKTDYLLGDPPRLISINRQMAQKDPTPIIRALAQIEDATLTLVGRGPIHQRLRELVRSLGLEHRVEFIPTMPNRELVAMLGDYDLFVACNRYGGISKAVLEALFTGLPIVHSRHPYHVPEFLGQAGLLVDETPEDFARALKRVLSDQSLREEMAARGREVTAPADPERTEARLAALYRELLSGPEGDTGRGA